MKSAFLNQFILNPEMGITFSATARGKTAVILLRKKDFAFFIWADLYPSAWSKWGY